MKFGAYLKDRSGFIGANLLFFLGVSSLLWVLKINLIIIIGLMIIWFMPLLTYMSIEYFKYNKYITSLQEVSEAIEKGYLVSEIIKEPSFLERRLIQQNLKSAHRAMLEEVKREQEIQRAYKEYIEAWVHEIKTPLASIGLIIENEDTETISKVAYETRRINHYIEQVLYYARSGEIKSDYLIKPFTLRDIVMAQVKEYKTDFIRKKIGIELGELDYIVYSDRKWVSFILSQILNNALKYMEEGKGKIKVYAQTYKNQIVLTIEDEGVGISEKDIGRVFDKGFTGENGRCFGKSTGIGLYLCKQLCSKLGLAIKLTSQKDIGTIVQIVFPVGDEQILLT